MDEIMDAHADTMDGADKRTAGRRVVIVGGDPTRSMLGDRLAMLDAIYPDERSSDILTVINIGRPAHRPASLDEIDARRERRRDAEEEARRAAMRADFERAYPITDGDRARTAAAEAKRARRRARNQR